MNTIFVDLQMSATKLNPSAPLEPITNVGEREKKINDINSFNNSINNFLEMMTYFKDESRETKTKIWSSIHHSKNNWYFCEYCHNSTFCSIICYWVWIDCDTKFNWNCMWFNINWKKYMK